MKWSGAYALAGVGIYLVVTDMLARRRAGIDGWVTNHPVVVGEKLHYLDIAFPELRLNFELDGWEFHSGYSSFVEDRRRDVNLSKAGWSVLRFTDPSVDELVEAATVMIPRRRHELRLG